MLRYFLYILQADRGLYGASWCGKINNIVKFATINFSLTLRKGVGGPDQKFPNCKFI